MRRFPDPFEEIQLVQLRFLPGANFWSRRPIARVDVRVGTYEDISSADVPGFAESLLAVLPGLIEHRCSIGKRGGFVERLQRGTYAPHILEHLALELQALGGDDLGFGRARGGDSPEEYTVVFRYRRRELARIAAELGLEIVRRAFDRALGSFSLSHAPLRAAGDSPTEARPQAQIACAVTGGTGRGEARVEVIRAAACDQADVLALTPAEILRDGLPYAASEVAIILGADIDDVPERYRDHERARQLVSVVADVLVEGGIAIAPAGDIELQDRILDAGARLGIFVIGAEPPAAELARAEMVARCVEGVLQVRSGGREQEAGPRRAGASLASQLAAAAASVALRESSPSAA